MAKDLIKFSNDEKGFLSLLCVVALLLLWAVSATAAAWKGGNARYAFYGAICVLGIGYIFFRSLRSYLKIRKKDPGEQQKTGENNK